MGFRNFRLNVILRVVAILVMSTVFGLLLTKPLTLFIPMATLFFLIAQAINLIQYIEHSNRELAHFLLTIKQQNFIESYPDRKKGSTFRELTDTLTSVVREFAKLNEQKELHHQFLLAINENVNIGILSYEASGKVMTVNTAFKALLNIVQLNTIDDLIRTNQSLAEVIQNIRPEERLVKRMIIRESFMQLSIQCKEIVLLGKPIRIILLQNLNAELDQKELEAWHQLMHVLTHEIMNSVTPILSLSNAMKKLMAQSSEQQSETLSSDNHDDLKISINTIVSQSKGLLSFVESYRQYSKPLSPVFQETNVTALLENAIQLFKTELTDKNITLSFINHAKKAVYHSMDAMLMERVLINLIKNAADSLENAVDGIITVSLSRQQHQILITVADNGDGIAPEMLPKIFVPFFTTKQHGTGIGLSLSRQIVKVHRGELTVQSVTGATKFTIALSDVQING